LNLLSSCMEEKNWFWELTQEMNEEE
jgi:hypothetical protein